jgi:hypothetical protein
MPRTRPEELVQAMKLTAKELIAVEKEREHARRQHDRAETLRVRKAQAKQVLTLERQIAVLAEVDAARRDLPPIRAVRKGREQAGDLREAAAFVVASDWHVEERVDPKTVQGLNEYNPEIARRRAERFFEGVAWLIREQRHTFTLNELYLAAIGDFITGYIHEELREGNFMSPTQATMFWMEIFEQGIRSVLAELDNLTIKIAFRFGNHGRTTAKTQVATAAANSYEWMAYHMLRKQLADEPRVHCQVDEGHHSIVEIYDYRIHLHHGDSVRSAGGIGGVDVPLNRAVAQWRNKYRSHLSVVGHFHQLQMGERLMRNGSLIGYGAYSDWLPSAEPEPAQQIFCVIDRSRGKCKNTPIWVQESSR